MTYGGDRCAFGAAQLQPTMRPRRPWRAPSGPRFVHVVLDVDVDATFVSGLLPVGSAGSELALRADDEPR